MQKTIVKTKLIALVFCCVIPLLTRASAAQVGKLSAETWDLIRNSTPTVPDLTATPSPEAPRFTLDYTGALIHLGAPAGRQFEAGFVAGEEPYQTAVRFLREHAVAFGLASRRVGFIHETTRARNNRYYVRLRQACDGLPVFGAWVVVQLNAAQGVEFLATGVERDLRALEALPSPLKPALSPAAATGAARTALASLAPQVVIEAGPASLGVFCPSVLGFSGKQRLVWEVDLMTSTLAHDEHVLVDANTGDIVFRFPLTHFALNREVFDSNKSSADPGTLVRREGDGPAALAEANQVFGFLGDTFQFYLLHHGRDSIDGLGMTLSASVRYCNTNFIPGCPMANAFWQPVFRRMYYGQGFVTDDVTGHELTHGVTSAESHLQYWNASGAMDESFADIWGEFIDWSNQAGDDSAGARWLFGEDLSGG